MTKFDTELGSVMELYTELGSVMELYTELDLVVFVLDSVPKPLLLEQLGHLVDGQVL